MPQADSGSERRLTAGLPNAIRPRVSSPAALKKARQEASWGIGPRVRNSSAILGNVGVCAAFVFAVNPL